MSVSDFVRSTQAFCIISLLCGIVCSIILIAAFVLRCLHRSRLALIGLSLLTFTSGKSKHHWKKNSASVGRTCICDPSGIWLDTKAISFLLVSTNRVLCFLGYSLFKALADKLKKKIHFFSKESEVANFKCLKIVIQLFLA